jgi:AraC-like DNA-binding protein
VSIGIVLKRNMDAFECGSLFYKQRSPTRLKKERWFRIFTYNSLPMDISRNMLLFIVGVGILQSTLLAAIIYFHHRTDRTVSKFLAWYILLFSIPMCSPLIQHFLTWQYLILVDPFPLLLGPMLYFYVRSFKEEVTFKKMWPHFLPFAVYVGLDISLYIDFTHEYPPGNEVPVEVLHHPSSIFRVSGRIIHKAIYFVLAGRQLVSYQKSIHHLFSETSLISLGWVRWLVNGFLFLTLLMAALYMLILQFPDKFAIIILLNTAIVTPYFYLITFRGITQPTLWQAQKLDKTIIQQEIQEVEEIDSKEPVKALHTVADEKTKNITARALALMEKERLHLKTDLTLNDLAEKLQVPSYLVTVALNDGLKKTFYDLVNGYRVEEAKRLLLDPKTKNNKILALGFDSGFNSKTTFNTVFKKFTGLTPTEFREKHEITESANAGF